MSFLKGQNISEDFFGEHDPIDAISITFDSLMGIYKKCLKKYRAEIVYGDTKKISEVIKSIIKLDLPLHLLYLTDNLMCDGKPVLHYSVLIGYDDTEDAFIIADPYDSIKSLKKDDFLILFLSGTNVCQI